MKREKLNTLNERDLILGLITSDKFCKEVAPILNPRHLEIDYTRIISGWIKDYVKKFGLAPKKDILKLYRAHAEEITDESLQDNILTFIEKVANDFDNQKTFNDEYAIQQAIQYLKSRSLLNFSEDINSFLTTGEIGKAEALITKYRKVEKESGEGVSILDDSETVLNAFTEEQDKLFAFDGVFGRLVGDIHREDFIAFLAPMKAGKCLGYGTKILMADGSIKEVQNLVVGDKLMGVDSKPRNVEIVSKGFGKMYHITSRMNSLAKNKKPDIDFICNGAHILVLKNAWKESKIEKFNVNGTLNGEYKKHGKNNWLKESEIEISVEDFLKLSPYMRERYKLFRTGVEYSAKEHVISPYLLGLWLGDGTSSAPCITTLDSEIINYCSDWCKSVGEDLLVSSTSKNKDLKSLWFRKCKNTRGVFGNELKRLNCINNKHIPEEYFIDSIENRLSLLAGIIDTDGYSDGKCIEINLMNQTLIKDVEKLCQQLGFKTTFLESYKQYKNMYPETNGWAYSWSVKITGKLSIIPVLLERKKAKDSKKFTELNNAFSFDIEELSEDNYYGFVLDGDHKFLLADTTVSHNTFQLIDCGIEALKNGLNVVFYSLEMSRTNMIKRIWKALSGQVTEDIKLTIPYFIEDGNKYTIENKVSIKKASSVLEIEKKQKSLRRMFRGGSFRVYAEPAYSLTVESLETKLDDLVHDGFVPDVIIIDYADIMMPSDRNSELRNQLDGIWKRLRAMAQKRKAVVFTASQTNRGAISREVEAEDVAEDIRKLAHVTSMVSISKTKYCKEHSLAIYSQLAVREGEPEMRKVIATQCLTLGRPVLDSHWKDDVILDLDEDNSDGEEKSEIKRKRK